jgi:hypothetical protein
MRGRFVSSVRSNAVGSDGYQESVLLSAKRAGTIRHFAEENPPVYFAYLQATPRTADRVLSHCRCFVH